MTMKKYRFSLQYPKPLTDAEFEALRPLMLSGGFSRFASDVTDQLEKELAAFFGVKHAITCSSGTAAIHTSLIALDLPVGSEVITTPITDVGVVLPIIYQNLIPVFADIDPTTFNLDPASVERCITPNTSAIIAVHLAGNPAPLDELRALAKKHKLVLIEDCSQAHGAQYGGKPVGSIGDLGLASLQQSKHITSGEGGVVLTHDDAMAHKLRLTVDKGWERFRSLRERRYVFLSLNYRYTGIQAAVVLPQLRRIDSILGRKRTLAKLLYSRLEQYSEYLGFQRVLDGAVHSYYSFPMWVNGDMQFRNDLLKVFEEDFGVESAYGYANPLPLYLCTAALEDPKGQGRGLLYSDRRYPAGTCPAAEDLLNRSFLIPFNEEFTPDEMNDIVDRLGKSLERVLSKRSVPVGA
jgi:perosamine synthetase